MDLTILLAQIMGIYFLVAGVGIFLNPDRAIKAMQEVTRSYLIPYFDGAMALIVGLLIVLTHNVWNDAVSSIVSLVGWLAVVEGVAMLILPQATIMGFMKGFMSKNAVTAFAAISAAVGAYLVYAGFFM